MKIRIRRIDKSIPLPAYQTKGAVAFDLASRTMVVVPPKGVAYAPLNVCVETPEAHMFFLAARSSLQKRGLMLANSVGIGDQDFSGNDDEYTAALYNFTDAPVTVERGDRIVQGIIKPIVKCEWEEVEDLGRPSRGGFGTTGAL